MRQTSNSSVIIEGANAGTQLSASWVIYRPDRAGDLPVCRHVLEALQLWHRRGDNIMRTGVKSLPGPILNK